MRVVYFIPYFLPEKTAGGHLVLDLLEGFARQGWKVDIYAPTLTSSVSSDERADAIHRRNT